MTYTAFEHKHNFAVWSAARASQRGYTTVANLQNALEACGLREFLLAEPSSVTTREAFDSLHRKWCRKICKHLNDNKGVIKVATYGRAAKLLNMYLKVMVVIAFPDSPLAKVTHPPIDGILLTNMCGDKTITHPNKRSWGDKKWTASDEKEYFDLLNEIITCLSPDEPLWMLEKYGTVTHA